MLNRDMIIEKLKEKGLKVTPQRLAVIDALIDHSDLHPGTRLIYEAARKKKVNLSLSTTYATLDELSRHGIIKTLQFDRMENRFDRNLKEHINLICEGCGKMFDYPVPAAVDPGDVKKRTGFTVTDSRLEYYGYCRECRTKMEEGR